MADYGQVLAELAKMHQVPGDPHRLLAEHLLNKSKGGDSVCTACNGTGGTCTACNGTGGRVGTAAQGTGGPTPGKIAVWGGVNTAADGTGGPVPETVPQPPSETPDPGAPQTASQAYQGSLLQNLISGPSKPNSGSMVNAGIGSDYQPIPQSNQVLPDVKAGTPAAVVPAPAAATDTPPVTAPAANPQQPIGPPPAIAKATGSGGSGGGLSGTDAKDQALIKDSYLGKSDANTAQRNVETKEAQQLAPLAQQNAADQAKTLQTQQENQNWARKTAQAQLASATSAMQEYGNSKVDPNEFWNSRSTGQKFGISAAMLLSGIGSALTKQDNAAMKIYTDARDADIQAQKDAFERKKGAGTAYADLMSKATAAGLSENEASQASTSALKALADRQQVATLASNGGDQAKAKWLAASASDQQDRALTDQKLLGDVSQRHMQTASAASTYQEMAARKYALTKEKAIDVKYGLQPPAGLLERQTNEGFAASPAQATKVQEADSAYGRVQAAGQAYMQALQKPDGITAADRRAAAKNYQAELAGYMNIARAAGQPEEKGSALNSMADPGWVDNRLLAGEALNKAKATQELMKGKHKAVLHGINQNLAPDINAAPAK